MSSTRNCGRKLSKVYIFHRASQVQHSHFEHSEYTGTYFCIRFLPIRCDGERERRNIFCAHTHHSFSSRSYCFIWKLKFSSVNWIPLHWHRCDCKLRAFDDSLSCCASTTQTIAVSQHRMHGNKPKSKSAIININEVCAAKSGQNAFCDKTFSTCKWIINNCIATQLMLEIISFLSLNFYLSFSFSIPLSVNTHRSRNSFMFLSPTRFGLISLVILKLRNKIRT